MHELSVASAVLNTALKHCGDRQVTVVNVRVGRMRQVVPASLEFYFEIVARDTACEGARLELVEIEPQDIRASRVFESDRETETEAA